MTPIVDPSAPTPEETTAALLDQGYTREQIISDAEANVEDAEAGIAWVDAVAARQADPLDVHVAALTAAQDALRRARAAGASVGDSELDAAESEVAYQAEQLDMVTTWAEDARAAAEQHRAYALETIDNARRRIAAAKKK